MPRHPYPTPRLAQICRWRSAYGQVLPLPGMPSRAASSGSMRTMSWLKSETNGQSSPSCGACRKRVQPSGSSPPERETRSAEYAWRLYVMLSGWSTWAALK